MATWVAHGDSNSKYSHAQLKSRQAGNKVSSIYNGANVRLADPSLIQKEFMDFFQKLLGEAALVLSGIDLNIVRNGLCLSIAQQ